MVLSAGTIEVLSFTTIGVISDDMVPLSSMMLFIVTNASPNDVQII